MNFLNNNNTDNQPLVPESGISKNKIMDIVNHGNALQEKEKEKEKINRNQISRNISFPKKNFTNLMIDTNGFDKNIKRIKSNSKLKIRNGLFSERLFAKTYKTNEEIGKLSDKMGLTSEKFSKKINSLKLPFLGEKIIFNKGETEKLLNYQFYNTSYKACCQISQYNNIPNSSMKANYKNNWNIVTNYVNEKRDDEYRTKNKKEKRNKTEYN